MESRVAKQKGGVEINVGRPRRGGALNGKLQGRS